MSTCSIVVSMFNAGPKAIEIIDKHFFPSLLRNAASDKQLILLDDASPLERETSDLVAKYAPSLKARFGDFSYSRNPQNLGFGGSYNKGMRQGEGRNLLITNDDVYFPLGSVEALLQALKEEPGAGLVGPVTNGATSYQNTRLFARIKNYSPSEQRRIEQFAQELNRKVGNKLIPVDRLIGFCLAVSSDLLRDVGYFDDSFTHGSFEDDDYCIRARNAGYKVLLDASTFVEHGGPYGGAVSLRQNLFRTLKYTLKNGARLARKHRIPYAGIARRFVDGALQFQFDKKTVTAELKRCLVTAH